MKFVIFADLEGATHVGNNWDNVRPPSANQGVTTKAYEYACGALMLDLFATIRGLRRVDPSAEITIVDFHWDNTNVSTSLFQTHDVKVLQGMTPGLNLLQEGSIDGALLVGAHAKNGAEGCLAHTWDTDIQQLSIDGIVVGEVGILARVFSCYRVPLCLVAGDDTTIKEAGADPFTSTAYGVITKVWCPEQPEELIKATRADKIYWEQGMTMTLIDARCVLEEQAFYAGCRVKSGGFVPDMQYAIASMPGVFEISFKTGETFCTTAPNLIDNFTEFRARLRATP